ncbi:MAG: DUF4266 domain-containing protein [Bacteroidota bacterium]
MRALFMLILLCITASGCVSVKEYQKMYVNDKDMGLHDQPIETYEINMQTYREGAAGGNGGKAGGGCGCN